MFKKRTISEFPTGGGGNKSSLIELLLNKPRAFTMAEVLITLGIIGIVAAMTLPTVINNARDRQFRAMFKKQFSVISQALQMIVLEDGNVMDFDDWHDMVIHVCRIGEKLNAAKSGLRCDEVLSNYTSGTNYARIDKNFQWHGDGKWYDKQGTPLILNNAYTPMTFYLPDGAWINLSCYRQILVDVNGAKKPNTVGRDIFYFVFSRQNSMPGFWENKSDRLYTTVNACSNFDSSHNSTAIYEDSYQDDCENGSGWGCSPLYILQ